LGLREDPVIEWRDYKNRAALNAINTLLGAYPHLHDIQARLTDLIAMATEEYPETDIPNSAAIGSFSALMQTHKFRVSPRISLTPGGHLVAEWGPSEGRSVAFQFLADSTINFSARIPDDSKGGRLMPTYGATSLTGLYRRISYDPAFSWLSLDGSNAPSAPADTE
jgi:hypothetical protein